VARRQRGGPLEKFFVYVFPVSNLYDEDDKPIFENLIHDAIIARADPVKRIVAFHLRHRRVRQILGEAIYSIFDSTQVFI
jgi:hypothetical protein